LKLIDKIWNNNYEPLRSDQWCPVSASAVASISFSAAAVGLSSDGQKRNGGPRPAVSFFDRSRDPDHQFF
jgi:hypothetical protein